MRGNELDHSLICNELKLLHAMHFASFSGLLTRINEEDSSFALKAAAKNRFIHTWLNRAQRQSSIKQNYAEIQLYELFKQHTDQQKVKVFWKLCGCGGGLCADVVRGPHLPCACVFMTKQDAL